MLQVLKEKVTSLSDNRKSAIAADVNDIVYTSTGDISIYYDEKGNAGRGNFMTVNCSSKTKTVSARGQELGLHEQTLVALQSLYHF